MAVNVVMPQLGESVVEGTITKWHVKPGDSIEKDATLVTVSTDKADTDVPSPASGVVTKLLAEEQQVVPVNVAIAEIDEAGAKAAPKGDDKGEAKPAEKAEPAAEAKPAEGEPKSAPPSSPVVRKLAREHDVDLADVQGTGERGRVTRDDMVAAVESRSSKPPAEAQPKPESTKVEAPSERPAAKAEPAASAPAPSAAPAKAAAPAAPRTGGFQPRPYVQAPGDEVVPFNRRRRIIADHMVYSKSVAPHVYTFAEIDLHKVSRLRESKKEAYKAEGVSLTFLAFVAAATARALRENPVLNARVLDDAYVKLRDINLGIAVETPAGLLVPVVKNADELSVKGLARQIDSLAKKARDGKIEADDLAGSTFTVSNPGLKGNFVGAAVINQPNVAILRTGEIVKRPVVVEVDGVDTIAIHPVMFVALSYDHRIVDGVAANNFLHRITELLETAPFEL